MATQRTIASDLASGPSSTAGTYECAIQDVDVEVSSDCPHVLRWLSYLLPAGQLRTDVDTHERLETIPLLRYHVATKTSATFLQPGVYFNSHLLSAESRPGVMQGLLEHSITLEVAKALSASDHHLVHGAAVVLDGQGILLPAASGSGKSTLAAGLAMSGFTYLTDEMIVLSGDGQVMSYAKGITLKTGGWHAVSEAFPEARRRVHAPLVSGHLSHLVPEGFSPAHSFRAFPVEAIILPSYDRDQETAIATIPRSDALAQLVRESLDLQIKGPSGLSTLAALVRSARCFAVRVGEGDLATAVSMVRDALTFDH